MTHPIIETLQKALAPEKVLTDSHARKEKRHDYWILSQLEDMQGRGAPEPICVVQPTETRDVIAIVNACRESATPLATKPIGRVRAWASAPRPLPPWSWS